jgi:hypothetical protein
MTMLIELDSCNRASLRKLFDRYPCLHGVVAAVIEGDMGRVLADARAEPRVARVVLDFHLLAGDPFRANASLLFKQLQTGMWSSPQPGVAAAGSCDLSRRVDRISSRSLSGRTIRYRQVERVLSGSAGDKPALIQNADADSAGYELL